MTDNSFSVDFDKFNKTSSANAACFVWNVDYLKEQRKHEIIAENIRKLLARKHDGTRLVKGKARKQLKLEARYFMRGIFRGL